MNILFIHNYNVCEPVAGGIVRVTGTLGHIFASHGHHCSIAYYENPATGTPSGYFEHSIQIHKFHEEDELLDIIKKRSINRIILQVPLNNRTKRLFYIVGKLGRNRKGVISIHCIHQVPFAETKGYDFSYLFFLLFHKSDKSIKEIIWGLVVLLFPRYAIKRTARRYNFISDNIDRTVLLSERYIKEYERLVHCSNGSLFGINNPVEKVIDDDYEAKEKIILFVGRMHEPTKRISILLQVWKKIYKKHPDWKLVLVGDGIDRSYYEKMVMKKKICNISFEGIQSPEKYYAKAAIYASTSPHEGFVMSVVEAMSYGAVPISFDGFDAIYDIIENEINGIIVPYKNLRKYGRSLEKLMTDEDMRNRMSVSCRKKVEVFSPDRIYNLWCKVLS